MNTEKYSIYPFLHHRVGRIGFHWCWGGNQNDNECLDVIDIVDMIGGDARGGYLEYYRVPQSMDVDQTLADLEELYLITLDMSGSPLDDRFPIYLPNLEILLKDIAHFIVPPGVKFLCTEDGDPMEDRDILIYRTELWTGSPHPLRVSRDYPDPGSVPSRYYFFHDMEMDDVLMLPVLD
jgi:hypothetical protein